MHDSLLNFHGVFFRHTLCNLSPNGFIFKIKVFSCCMISYITLCNLSVLQSAMKANRNFYWLNNKTIVRQVARHVKADFQSSHEAPRCECMHEHFHPITMLNCEELREKTGNPLLHYAICFATCVTAKLRGKYVARHVE